MTHTLPRSFCAAFACVALAAGSLAAQQSMVGTILIAHGGGPDWDAQVLTIAELADTGGPIEVSFLMGSGAQTHRFQDAARRLVDAGATEIVVVPLLVSSHSGHYQQIRYLVGQTDDLSETMHHHLHMSGIERAAVTVPITLTRAIDDAPEAARVLAERAAALARQSAAQAVFLIAHGPSSAEDNATWMSNLRPLAEHVKTTGGFRNVMVGTIRDDAPAEVRAEAVRSIRETIALQHMATGQDVVVVPVLISTGSVSREKIPADLDGLPIIYTGDALLPHPGMARWVEARVRDRGMNSENAAAATSRNHVRQVTITMSEFNFAASDTVFEAGVPYRFVLRNVGHISHEWAIVPRGDADEDSLLYEVEEDELPPGATVTRDFVFPVAGDYDFACFMVGHYEAGMVVPVRVRD